LLEYHFLQDTTYTDDKDTFYTCTGRKAATSEHRTRNLVITSPMRYRCNKLVCLC